MNETKETCIMMSLCHSRQRQDCDRHGLGSKPTRAVLLCLRKKHFRTLSRAYWCLSKQF